MRTITATERAYLQDTAGFKCYAYLEVTNPDGTWINLGAIATPQATLDFENTAHISDGIDANTISFAATMELEIGNESLVPFRSDSDVNVDDAGAFGPLLDLARQWKVWCAIVPHGIVPGISDYREMARGYITKLVVADVITVEGMGMEAPILDAYVTADRTYSDDLETVIEDALADEFGTAVIPLTSSPSGEHVDVTIGSTNLFPVLADSAALIGDSLRYRYNGTSTPTLTVYTPPRDATVADWSIGGDEYERMDITIDKAGIRNFIVIDYPDETFGDSTVVSPAAQTGTLSCTAGAGTFSTSQAGVIAVGATIVVDRGDGDYVAYTVSTFNGTTGCTLAGAPTFTATDWYTSASITKYGLLIYALDLTTKEAVLTQARAGGLADSIRSDLEDPALEQSFVAPGLWFVELGDFVTTLANGVHYVEDQSGGVTSYTHDFSGGLLLTTVGLSGKPKGRYALWRKIGTDTPRTAFTPEILQLTATAQELLFGSLRLPGILAVAAVNDRTRSVKFEYSTTIDFLSIGGTDSRDVLTDPGNTAWTSFGPTTPDTQYYVRATPYSGPLSGTDPTGVAGTPVIVPLFNNRLTPSQADLDTIGDTVDNLGNTLGQIGVPVQLLSVPEDDQWLALSTIPTAETEVGPEYRQQSYAVGVGSVRLGANIKTLTGTPTIGAQYTLDGFSTTPALVSFTPTGTDVQYSGFVPMPSAAKADIGLTWTVGAGADTAALDLYRVWLEFIPATVSGARIHTDAFAPAFN